MSTHPTCRPHGTTLVLWEQQQSMVHPALLRGDLKLRSPLT